MPYHAILYFTILYYTILYHPILYYTILYHPILYYTILYYTILYYTILHYTIPYYTILYHPILYYTILYYTILYYTILYYIIPYYTILIICSIFAASATFSKKSQKKSKEDSRIANSIKIPSISLDSSGRPILPIELAAGLTIYSIGEVISQYLLPKLFFILALNF